MQPYHCSWRQKDSQAAAPCCFAYLKMYFTKCLRQAAKANNTTYAFACCPSLLGYQDETALGSPCMPGQPAQCPGWMYWGKGLAVGSRQSTNGLKQAPKLSS